MTDNERSRFFLSCLVSFPVKKRWALLSAAGSPEALYEFHAGDLPGLGVSLTVPEIAMRYVFASSMNLFAVMSTTKAERLDSAIRAAANPLTAAEAKWLEEGDTQDV